EGLILLEVQEGDKHQEVLMSEKFACSDCGVSYPSPEPRTFSFNSPMGACPSCDGLGTDPEWNAESDSSRDPEESRLHEWSKASEPSACNDCHGARLRKESLHYKVAEQNIAQLCQLSIGDLAEFFSGLKLTDRESLIVSRVIKEIRERAHFLSTVGVSYLSLSRSAQSLSGGEAQRIRLATQIGSSLVGVIYVLDEPSIGLHQRDNEKLIRTLERLRDLGNTVLVVEHDMDTMRRADFLADLGPGAGAAGGDLVACGTPQEVAQNKSSVTGKYLAGTLEIETPKTRRTWTRDRSITILGAKSNNLKGIDVSFPLGVLTCITGVSGSGKSSLVMDTLYRAMIQRLYKVDVGELHARKILGLEHIDKVIDIDQSPIGKTPRSNPATYTGVFSMIRELFSQLPESQVRGYGPGRYSFNVKGGRCEVCEGDGVTRIEMHFLPDVFVTCSVCGGKRYSRETLEIRYKGKSISDVLEMPISQAAEFFDAVPSIKSKLHVLNEVGLGYLQLGQSATTLSGGEAQRIKLSKELSRRSTGKTIYILDEPSTGLHFDDVKKLIRILQSLVDQGNTVLVIEHNLDIIKVADHLIDLGPEGGGAGGMIVASGTPEEVAACSASYTGQFLKPYLRKSKR
ncbi:MAG: excinuclease ABC subunit UvrA, partial [Bdellovibrionales bacterium]|nr:excinuclease ABC subunit UvrA [Bdellovibrionales bacterium]